MEKDIYNSADAKYSDDVRVFVLNIVNGQLELYQIQQLTSMDDQDIRNAVLSGMDLITGIHVKTFIQEERSFSDIELARMPEDPANVFRLAYIDPSRIQIVNGKIQHVMVTYGVIQMPCNIELNPDAVGSFSKKEDTNNE